MNETETILEANVSVEDVNPEIVEEQTPADGWVESTEDVQPGDVEMVYCGTTETPASVTTDSLAKEFKDNYGLDIKYEDIACLIELKKRLATDPTTNIYAELPTSVQKAVKNAFGQAFGGAQNMSISDLNYVSNVFIDEIFTSAELDGYITEFNEALSDLRDRTKEENIENDCRLDDIFEKVTTMYEKRDTYEDEESKVKAEKTHEAFMTAISFSKILESIEERPSRLNRAFKEAARFNSYAMDFDSKFCCGESNVKVRTLEAVRWALAENAFINEDYAKTICILIAENTRERNIDDIYDKWYVYYLTEVSYLLHKTTLVGDVTSKTSEAIKSICAKLDDLCVEKAARKGKGKKRG